MAPKGTGTTVPSRAPVPHCPLPWLATVRTSFCVETFSNYFPARGFHLLHVPRHYQYQLQDEQLVLPLQLLKHFLFPSRL